MAACSLRALVCRVVLTPETITQAIAAAVVNSVASVGSMLAASAAMSKADDMANLCKTDETIGIRGGLEHRLKMIRPMHNNVMTQMTLWRFSRFILHPVILRNGHFMFAS